MNYSIQCYICREAAEDAVTSECGHGYCSNCINTWLNQSALCPVCKATISKNQLRKCYVQVLVGDPIISTQNFQIFVKTLTGQSLSIDNAHVSDSIRSVKEKIEKATGMPQSEQRLIFSGKQLEDNKSLSDYGFNNGSVIHLVGRLRGGLCFYEVTRGS
uniref:Ubiquitin n=1 Tax=Ditylenchus dipsaci TaxID=166011 RepID=A0A915DRX9_9BILA